MVTEDMQALESRLTRGLTKQELEGFFRITEKLKQNLAVSCPPACKSSASS